ncbi:hypothetical protein LWI29_019506 [Acer saccharum]|uniref:Uncharacterized protein n=1 Tax=Acer saccharum TaxID=4024 RepID=A0AA39SW20_ACESA|nr:hypothetical protein LWI29_019506 [Acer saccharum]
MEEIFSIVSSENEEIVLEKLDSLSLGRLPKLRSFSYEEEVGSTSDEERQMKDTLMPLSDGKVQLILEEQEALETLTNTMVEPPAGNTAQHRRDMETYQTWKRRTVCSHNDAKQLLNSFTPSPKSASKKLASPFRCLSLKKIDQPGEETENLQQPENDPYQDLETAYVAQICLTWEALHCQYLK